MEKQTGLLRRGHWPTCPRGRRESKIKLQKWQFFPQLLSYKACFIGFLKGLCAGTDTMAGCGGCRRLPGQDCSPGGGPGGVSMKTSLREAVGYACVRVCAQHDGSPFIAIPGSRVKLWGDEIQETKGWRNNASADGQGSETRAGACCFKEPTPLGLLEAGGTVGPG